MFLDTIPAGRALAFQPTSPTPSVRDSDSPTDWPTPSSKMAFTSSMQADLRKLADSPAQCSALAVVAASVRHSHPMAMKVQVVDDVATLAVFPRDRLFRCELDLCALSQRDMGRLRLVQVESAAPLMPTTDAARARKAGMGPLGPMLWQLAKYGPTHELLAEIAGPANYRLAPSLNLGGLEVDSQLTNVLLQMRRRPCSVDELAAFPGFTRARVCRLLNAIYLQAGLIVTRSLPGLWA